MIRMMPEPVLEQEGNFYRAVFKTDNMGLASAFIKAFVASAANSNAPVALWAADFFRTRKYKDVHAFRLALETVQIKGKRKWKKFSAYTIDGGVWRFSWLCNSYRKRSTDNAAVPETPTATNIFFYWGTDLLKLVIASGRETSVLRHTKAALGEDVPVSWKVITGIEPHPE